MVIETKTYLNITNSYKYSGTMLYSPRPGHRIFIGRSWNGTRCWLVHYKVATGLLFDGVAGTTPLSPS